MLIFGNDKNTRGCFLVFRMNTSEGRGAQLRLPDDYRLPEDNYNFPLTVVGFHFTQAENVHFTKCFGDYVYTYGFGHDPHQSQLTVEFAAMLRNGREYAYGRGGGSSFNGSSGIVEMVTRDYEANRVSKSLKMAKFFVGGTQEILKGFIVSMTSATMDPQHSLQSFTMVMQLTEVQGK